MNDDDDDDDQGFFWYTRIPDFHTVSGMADFVCDNVNLNNHEFLHNFYSRE